MDLQKNWQFFCSWRIFQDGQDVACKRCKNGRHDLVVNSFK